MCWSLVESDKGEKLLRGMSSEMLLDLKSIVGSSNNICKLSFGVDALPIETDGKDKIG